MDLPHTTTRTILANALQHHTCQELLALDVDPDRLKVRLGLHALAQMEILPGLQIAHATAQAQVKLFKTEYHVRTALLQPHTAQEPAFAFRDLLLIQIQITHARAHHPNT